MILWYFATFTYFHGYLEGFSMWAIVCDCITAHDKVCILHPLSRTSMLKPASIAATGNPLSFTPIPILNLEKKQGDPVSIGQFDPSIYPTWPWKPWNWKMNWKMLTVPTIVPMFFTRFQPPGSVRPCDRPVEAAASGTGMSCQHWYGVIWLPCSVAPGSLST